MKIILNKAWGGITPETAALRKSLQVQLSSLRRKKYRAQMVLRSDFQRMSEAKSLKGITPLPELPT